MRYIALMLLVVSALLLVGCNTQVENVEPVQQAPVVIGDLEDQNVAPTGIVHQVVMESGHFIPNDLVIGLGDTVEWVNNDYRESNEADNYGGIREVDDSHLSGGELGIHHTVTFENGDFDATVPPGGMAQHVFLKRGTHRYFDLYEPGIQATINVE